MSHRQHQTVRVRLGPRAYAIRVTSCDTAGFGAFARRRSRGEFAFIVGDENVRERVEAAANSLRAVGFRTELAVLPPGEGQKCLATASQLFDRLADAGTDRRTLIVAVGGGVIGDLAGFVAATFARGLRLLMVPTTLLAMVDSSVGGKVAVNHPKAKNLIGAFHQPSGVWIDTAALDTLPDREYRSGLAEVVKYGVALDAEFLRYLETHAAAALSREPAVVRHLVSRSCRLKADVVEKDEREETGLRALLNYGHTFAHAFETVGGYGVWLHGEAVAAGMVCAGLLAERRGLIGRDLVERQRQLLAAFGLPPRPGDWPVDQLLQTMRSDKKSVAGRMRFVLPIRPGAATLVDNIPEEDVRQVLSQFLS